MPFKTCPQCSKGVREIDNKCWNCNHIFNPALEAAKAQERLAFQRAQSEAKEQRAKDDRISNLYLAFGVGLPLLLIAGCTIISLNTDPEETRAQRICTSQGRSCDSDGYPVGTSEKTKDLLEGKD